MKELDIKSKEDAADDSKLSQKQREVIVWYTWVEKESGRVCGRTNDISFAYSTALRYSKGSAQIKARDMQVISEPGHIVLKEFLS